LSIGISQKKQNIFPLTAQELLKILLDGKRYL